MDSVETTKVLVALGGNAILKHTERGTAEEQKENIQATAKKLVELIHAGFRLVITHGNGPQVGDILLKNDIAKTTLPAMPLDICSAESQGMIGYMLQQSLLSELNKAKIKMPVVTIISQTLVDARDPAFLFPTKPVGPFYTAMEAADLKKNMRWTMTNDSGRGYRRMVPSPDPIAIVEQDLIKSLFDDEVIVIASGGGGVPVVSKNGTLEGVEGVVDKDRAAVQLAKIISADTLLILTDVSHAYLDYGRPNQKPLHKVSTERMKEWLDEGQFAEGSMGPKVESAIKFVENGGKQAIITSIEHAMDALDGDTGTIITNEEEVR